MSPIKVKSADVVGKKWGEVTPTRAGYYETGASVAGDDWAKNAAAASSAFKAGVSAANIGEMYKGGIAKAGAAKYNRKVKDVGVARFSQGVQAGVADYQTGVTPMLETIAATNLPARAPRGSEANLARVREVATNLHKKRLALRAAGS